MKNGQNPPVRKTTDVRQESLGPSPDFESLFKPLPDGKLSCAYVEIEGWDRQTDSYSWEGQVWALVGPLAEIPEEKE